MMKAFRTTALAMVILLAVVWAVSAEENAAEILRKVEERQWADTSVSQTSMLVYPSADSDDHRSYEVLIYSQGEEDSYMTFMTPRNIKGLSILSKGSDQWIFFPSTGRVRKIAGKSKDQSIQGVGGDFSYEDLSAGQWEEKFDFSIVEENDSQWVLRGVPRQDSAYSKVIMVVDRQRYMITKIEFFQEDKGHFKDLVMDEVRLLDGREVATRMTMVNHVDNSKTVILIHDARYEVEVDDKYFNPNRFYR